MTPEGGGGKSLEEVVTIPLPAEVCYSIRRSGRPFFAAEGSMQAGQD